MGRKNDRESKEGCRERENGRETQRWRERHIGKE